MSTYMTLTDYNSNVYSFDPQFWLTDDSWATNKNILNVFYGPGGKNVSDGFLLPRNITIDGLLYADSQAAFETKLRALMQAVIKGGYLKFYSDGVSRQIEVKYADCQSNWENWPQVKNFSITFVAEFPFWEDVTETNSQNIVTGNDSFEIVATGSDYIVYPVIEIEADQAVNVPAVKMKNLDDGAMLFEYNDTNFQSGDLLVIDCKNGTVKLNNNNTIQYFNPARFLRLQPYSNTIEYEGAACTIRFKFRKVYL